MAPWQFKTKKIIDQNTDFNQTFFVPVANYWFTIKIELINLQPEGWLREVYHEKVIATF